MRLARATSRAASGSSPASPPGSRSSRATTATASTSSASSTSSSTEVKVLFDRRDPASLLWPRRAAFEELLGVLNAPELAAVWAEDETIGWVYQYFNSGDERRQMRDESQAPRNSRELAVRNQFFTPRYVVQFLTDNTLGRIWIEMMGDGTEPADRRPVRLPRPRRREPRPAGEEGPARPEAPRPGLRLGPLPALLRSTCS